MRTMKHSRNFAAVLFALSILTGCESTDDSGGVSGGGISGGVYYGIGFDDPWYYDGYYDRGDIIVTPPPNHGGRPVHPEQPIYRPSAPRPTPMPSIPSAPRPMMRR
jgi:hypothetical protein